ncbi:MAG TPA: DUF3300 domain-containing protein [Acidobacteriota bacterium]|nr:DUF3300 domain-containing protein [Acidobacteriota bacterium]
MKSNPATKILLTLALVAFTVLGSVTISGAQGQPSPAQEQQSQTVPAAQQMLSTDQLDNLVAPIALYPDPLLSQILVASTYPIEVVEASQWLQRNKNLQGQAAVDAAKQQSWDPSVQALVAVPDALEKLNQDIRWTTDLGNAFLGQESDVMSAVQRMRLRAQANGRLASTAQQNVITQDQGGQQVVVIEPADPDVIYVPAYDPFYVWGPPVYGFYPPLFYPAFGFGFGTGYDLGYCFAGWGGWGYWGWGPNWYGRSVFVNNYFFNHYGYHRRWDRDSRGRQAWVHNPDHRLNVPYANGRVAAQFGGRSSNLQNSYRAGSRPEAGAVPFAGRNAEPVIRGGQSQGQRYQNAPRQEYRAPQQYRSEQRVYSAPRVQQYQSRPQMRVQAPQQFRPAPQMSAPRSGGGGFNGGGFSGGGFRGGGGFSGGGGGGRHR